MDSHIQAAASELADDTFGKVLTAGVATILTLVFSWKYIASKRSGLTPCASDGNPVAVCDGTKVGVLREPSSDLLLANGNSVTRIDDHILCSDHQADIVSECYDDDNLSQTTSGYESSSKLSPFEDICAEREFASLLESNGQITDIDNTSPRERNINDKAGRERVNLAELALNADPQGKQEELIANDDGFTLLPCAYEPSYSDSEYDNDNYQLGVIFEESSGDEAADALDVSENDSLREKESILRKEKLKTFKQNFIQFGEHTRNYNIEADDDDVFYSHDLVYAPLETPYDETIYDHLKLRTRNKLICDIDSHETHTSGDEYPFNVVEQLDTHQAHDRIGYNVNIKNSYPHLKEGCRNGRHLSPNEVGLNGADRLPCGPIDETQTKQGYQREHELADGQRVLTLSKDQPVDLRTASRQACDFSEINEADELTPTKNPRQETSGVDYGTSVDPYRPADKNSYESDAGDSAMAGSPSKWFGVFSRNSCQEPLSAQHGERLVVGHFDETSKEISNSPVRKPRNVSRDDIIHTGRSVDDMIYRPVGDNNEVTYRHDQHKTSEVQTRPIDNVVKSMLPNLLKSHEIAKWESGHEYAGTPPRVENSQQEIDKACVYRVFNECEFIPLRKVDIAVRDAGEAILPQNVGDVDVTSCFTSSEDNSDIEHEVPELNNGRNGFPRTVSGEMDGLMADFKGFQRFGQIPRTVSGPMGDIDARWSRNRANTSSTGSMHDDDTQSIHDAEQDEHVLVMDGSQTSDQFELPATTFVLVGREHGKCVDDHNRPMSKSPKGKTLVDLNDTSVSDSDGGFVDAGHVVVSHGKNHKSSAGNDNLEGPLPSKGKKKKSTLSKLFALFGKKQPSNKHSTSKKKNNHSKLGAKKKNETSEMTQTALTNATNSLQKDHKQVYRLAKTNDLKRDHDRFVQSSADPIQKRALQPDVIQTHDTSHVANMPSHRFIPVQTNRDLNKYYDTKLDRLECSRETTNPLNTRPAKQPICVSTGKTRDQSRPLPYGAKEASQNAQFPRNEFVKVKQQENVNHSVTRNGVITRDSYLNAIKPSDNIHKPDCSHKTSTSSVQDDVGTTTVIPIADATPLNTHVNGVGLRRRWNSVSDDCNALTPDGQLRGRSVSESAFAEQGDGQVTPRRPESFKRFSTGGLLSLNRNPEWTAATLGDLSSLTKARYHSVLLDKVSDYEGRTQRARSADFGGLSLTDVKNWEARTSFLTPPSLRNSKSLVEILKEKERTFKARTFKSPLRGSYRLGFPVSWLKSTDEILERNSKHRRSFPISKLPIYSARPKVPQTLTSVSLIPSQTLQTTTEKSPSKGASNRANNNTISCRSVIETDVDSGEKVKLLIRETDIDSISPDAYTQQTTKGGCDLPNDLSPIHHSALESRQGVSVNTTGKAIDSRRKQRKENQNLQSRYFDYERNDNINIDLKRGKDAIVYQESLNLTTKCEVRDNCSVSDKGLNLTDNSASSQVNEHAKQDKKGMLSERNTSENKFKACIENQNTNTNISVIFGKPKNRGSTLVIKPSPIASNGDKKNVTKPLNGKGNRKSSGKKSKKTETPSKNNKDSSTKSKSAVLGRRRQNTKENRDTREQMVNKETSYGSSQGVSGYERRHNDIRGKYKCPVDDNGVMSQSTVAMETALQGGSDYSPFDEIKRSPQDCNIKRRLEFSAGPNDEKTADDIKTYRLVKQAAVFNVTGLSYTSSSDTSTDDISLTDSLKLSNNDGLESVPSDSCKHCRPFHDNTLHVTVSPGAIDGLPEKWGSLLTQGRPHADPSDGNNTSSPIVTSSPFGSTAFVNNIEYDPEPTSVKSFPVLAHSRSVNSSRQSTPTLKRKTPNTPDIQIAYTDTTLETPVSPLSTNTLQGSKQEGVTMKGIYDSLLELQDSNGSEILKSSTSFTESERDLSNSDYFETDLDEPESSHSMEHLYSSSTCSPSSGSSPVAGGSSMNSSTDTFPDMTSSAESIDSIHVQCRNPKCGLREQLSNAKSHFKTCHNCFTYYCSRLCRKSHWEKHKKRCMASRINSSCKHVIKFISSDDDILSEFSKTARLGYLTQGRGSVCLTFPSPDGATAFLNRTESKDCNILYVPLKELERLENREERHEEIIELIKAYNPEFRFVLSVTISTQDGWPARPSPRLATPFIHKCARVKLSESRSTPRSEGTDKSDTLVLTAVPGTPDGKIFEGPKAREVFFINVQRNLRDRGVSLRHQYPAEYSKLCAYVERDEMFGPILLTPRDGRTGRRFMCLIMPKSDPENEWLNDPNLLKELGLT